MITQEKLKETLHYDPETGLFTWKMTGTGRNSNGVVGHVNNCGYRHISIGGKAYLAHRLAWLYVHGEWPEEIDHINHIKLDNRMVNLRNTTKQENRRNKSLQRNSTSGFCGVHWSKRNNRWIAKIKVNREQIYLGCFSEKGDAIEARKAANKKYGYHENHGK